MARLHKLIRSLGRKLYPTLTLDDEGFINLHLALPPFATAATLNDDSNDDTVLYEDVDAEAICSYVKVLAQTPELRRVARLLPPPHARLLMDVVQWVRLSRCSHQQAITETRSAQGFGQP